MIQYALLSSLLLATACCLLAPEATAGDPARHAPSLRRSAFGWEAQGEHFVVLDPHDGRRAAEILGDLEEGWRQAEAWSANWRNEPLHPVQGPRDLVPVLVQPTPPPAAKRPIRALADTIEQAGTIVVDRRLLTEETSQRGTSLKTLGARWELRISGDAARLPDWVADGLAAFAANPAADIDWFKTSDHGPSRIANDGPSPAWVRYLLLANDGEHAAAFFAAVRTAVAAPLPPQRSVPRGAFAHREVEPARADSRAFLLPLAEHTHSQTFAEWRQDPSQGQPRIAPAAEQFHDLPAARQVEMAQIIKLAHKFAPADARVVVEAPRKRRPNEEPPLAFPDRPDPAVDLHALRQKLRSPDERGWATLDVDGRLLTGQNRSELDAFLNRAAREYTFVWHDRRSVLQWTSPTGNTYRAMANMEAEAEANGAQRPVVRFIRAEQP